MPLPSPVIQDLRPATASPRRAVAGSFPRPGSWPRGSDPRSIPDHAVLRNRRRFDPTGHHFGQPVDFDLDHAAPGRSRGPQRLQLAASAPSSRPPICWACLRSEPRFPERSEQAVDQYSVVSFWWLIATDVLFLGSCFQSTRTGRASNSSIARRTSGCWAFSLQLFHVGPGARGRSVARPGCLPSGGPFFRSNCTRTVSPVTKARAFSSLATCSGRSQNDLQEVYFSRNVNTSRFGAQIAILSCCSRFARHRSESCSSTSAKIWAKSITA